MACYLELDSGKSIAILGTPGYAAFGVETDAVVIRVDAGDGIPVLATMDGVGTTGGEAGDHELAFLSLLDLRVPEGGDGLDGAYISAIASLDHTPAWADNPPEAAKLRVVEPSVVQVHEEEGWAMVDSAQAVVTIPAPRLLRLADHPHLAAVYFPGREAPPEAHLLFVWVPR